MAEEKMMRLSQVARKLNVGRNTIIEHLTSKGFEVDRSPNSKITAEQFDMLAKEFASSAMDKEEAHGLTIGQKQGENFVIDSSQEKSEKKSQEEEQILIKSFRADESKPAKEEDKKEESEKSGEKETADAPRLKGLNVVGKIDLEADQKKKQEEEAKAKKEKEEKEVKEEKEEKEKKEKKEKEEKEEAAKAKAKEEAEAKEAKEAKEKEDRDKEEAEDEDVIEAKADSLKGLKVVGKIDLPEEKKKPKPVASSDDEGAKRKKKRPRKRITGRKDDRGQKSKKFTKEEPTDQEIQDQIKKTLAKLSGGKSSSSRSKYRREKRSAKAEEQHDASQEQETKTLKVTEFISANDLASLMDVSVNEVIATCMDMGMFVSINQRLDAEAITLITDEFGFDVQFISEDDEVHVIEEEDEPEDLTDRAPIVTIMGHVDHGKTSLLDFIRDAKVTEGEAGGITQHIGAYDVETESGKRIAFLDTPGHEAFTAMRARGAKITDVAIIVVAADDAVMPQTKEAINHAQVAGVPIVIAINKVDKPNANPDKIKEELSNINILVEDWGGKYQCQEISAKTGAGIDDLLEKVLLESELLELKANADKPAVGTVIEAELDKGRGYVATIMVQAGKLKVGDIMLAGSHYGKVKAMFDHRGKKVKEVGPSTPALILGLDGAPQAGDTFNVMESDREAREIATKREQINREQSLRTRKHITLDEIGRRLAIGGFKQLNIIVKGDVDGSVEALSDSMLKLSTEEIQVNIIHKAVGQITESDVLLASASDAIIIGFQVRPSGSARKLAETEEIEIRLYSIIYDAINEIKDAMEGMLEPTKEEVITGNIEVRDIFKISKVGTIAGCYVTDGNIKRSNQIRLVRDGIVVYTGEIDSLKRFKDDVSEVKSGYECGLSIKNFNDIKVGDVIEGFEEKEIKRSL